jgi:futalosine hydrolase
MQKGRLLLVSATLQEVAPLLQRYPYKHLEANLVQTPLFTLGITGVGLVNAATNTTRFLLSGTFDFALQMGIAGTFADHLSMGTCVQVVHDFMPELRVSTPAGYIEMKDWGLMQSPVNGYGAEGISNHSEYFSHLTEARSLSVQTVTGDEALAQRMKEEYKKLFQLDPDIESMEGAAFFTACSQLQIPCAQIRSISNRVENRDTSRWQIPLATGNLCEEIICFIETHVS